jgi:hypothetical protein
MKAPPLKYEGHDISLEFGLTLISGTTPKMGARFCTEKKDHTKCADGLTHDKVFGNGANFEIAKKSGSNLNLFIDHDESMCASKY